MVATAARLRLLVLALPAVLVALAPASAAPSESRTVVVARVVDGDTLVLRGGARIRLLQIDAPESGEECYAAASARELVRLARPGARVALETDPVLDRVDRFGRLLRYVHAAGRNVNVELVRRGAATPWFYDGDRGRYAAELLSAVTRARADRRGMWGACRVRWRADEPVLTLPR